MKPRARLQKESHRERAGKSCLLTGSARNVEPSRPIFRWWKFRKAPVARLSDFLVVGDLCRTFEPSHTQGWFMPRAEKLTTHKSGIG